MNFLKNARALLAGLLLLAPASSFGQLTWGINGGGGNGTWDSTTADWYNGSSNVAWIPGDSALFSGTGGIVSFNNGQVLSVSQITFSNTSGTYILGPGTIDGTPGFNVEADGNADLGPVITATSLTKTGAGTIELSPVNFFSGPITVSNGTVIFTSETTVNRNTSPSQWTAATFTVNSGATLTLDVSSSAEFENITTSDLDTILNLGTATGGFLSGSTVGLDVGGSDAVTYGNVIANPNGGANVLSLNKLDTGMLTLTGANTFTGTTTVTAGTLTLANSLALQNSTVTTGGTGLMFALLSSRAFTLGGLSGSADLALASGGVNGIALTVGNNNTDTTYSGILSGSGSLIKTGTGTLTLSGANSYNGGTTVNGGTLQFSGSGSLSGGNLTVNAGGTFNSWTASSAIFSGLTVNTGGTVNLNGTNTRVTNLNGTGGTILNNASGTNVTLTNVGNDNTVYAGVIADNSSGTGTVALTSTTILGSLTLSGANTYSGLTKITAGTLYANGGVAGTSSATGTGAISVTGISSTNLGILGGSGVIRPTQAGAGITLGANSGLTSGGVQAAASPTTVAGQGLTLDNQVAQGTILDASIGTTKLTFYLGAGNPTGTSSSYLTVLGNTAGELKFATGDTVTLTDLTNGNLQLALGTPYLLIQAGSDADYAGLTTTGGSVGGVAQDGAVTNLTLAGNTPAEYSGTFLFLNNGNLEVEAVPEPGTWAMMLGGLILLASLRTRVRQI